MMKKVIICNTLEDTLSIISTDNFSIYDFKFDKFKNLGPCALKSYKEKFLLLNNYDNSLFFLDSDFNIEKKLNVADNPIDFCVYNEYLFVIFDDLNSLLVYNLNDCNLNYSIKLQDCPYSMTKIDKRGLIAISNFNSNSVSIIDCSNFSVIKTLNTVEYPTKVLISDDEKYLFVCESYIEDNFNGYVEIFSTKNFVSLKKIMVGSCPIDIFENFNNLYVANFSDGSISVINKNGLFLENNIFIGSMPNKVIKYNDNLYVSDYLRKKLYIISNNNYIKKIISIGNEPNCMILN